MAFYQDRYIKINDQTSKNLFFVTDINSEMLLNKSIETQKISNSYGVKVKQINYDSKTVKYSIMFTLEMLESNEITNIYELKRLIANYFNSDEVVTLWDSKDPNIYQKVIYQGQSELTFLGNQTATCEVELLNPSGLSYSTTLREFSATPNDDGIMEVVIDSKGTALSDIIIETSFKHDNGYFAAVSNEGVIELGKKDEADLGSFTKVVKIIEQNGADWTGWTDGTSTTVFAENADKKAVTNFLTTTNFGGQLYLSANFTNTANSGVFGAIKEKTIETPAQNFYIWAKAWFETGLMGQTGNWSLAISDVDGKLIACMTFDKTDASGNTATINFIVGDSKVGGKKVLKTITFQPAYWVSFNAYGSQSRDQNRNMFDIRKEGKTIRFFYYGSYYSFDVPEIENLEASKIQFFAGQWKGRNSGSQRVPQMSINTFNFTDLKNQYWKDVPNRFAASDLLRIETENKTQYVNNLVRQEDMIRGTKYFKLPYGENTVQFQYSDFSTPAPEIKVYLREAYI